MSAGSACVFKVLTGLQWEALQTQGWFAGSPADLADGYVHLSTAAQAPGTLARHYAGQTGLVLAAVGLDALPADKIRWEPARQGDLFPHLYAPLPLFAVRAAQDIVLEADGTHRLPLEVLAWA